MQEQGMGQMATPVRREKHIEIDDALNQLDKELERLRNFMSRLSDGPVSLGEESNTKDAEPPFLTVYGTIAERVLGASKQLSEMTQQIKNMLL